MTPEEQKELARREENRIKFLEFLDSPDWESVTKEEFNRISLIYMDECDTLRVTRYRRDLTPQEIERVRRCAILAEKFDCVGVAPLPYPRYGPGRS